MEYCDLRTFSKVLTGRGGLVWCRPSRTGLPHMAQRGLLTCVLGRCRRRDPVARGSGRRGTPLLVELCDVWWRVRNTLCSRGACCILYTVPRIFRPLTSLLLETSVTELADGCGTLLGEHMHGEERERVESIQTALRFHFPNTLLDLLQRLDVCSRACEHLIRPFAPPTQGRVQKVSEKTKE